MTSGNVSPSLGTPIGMAYVPTRLTEPGTEIAVEIRGKAVPQEVKPCRSPQDEEDRAVTIGATLSPEDAAWTQQIAATRRSTSG